MTVPNSQSGEQLRLDIDEATPAASIDLQVPVLANGYAELTFVGSLRRNPPTDRETAEAAFDRLDGSGLSPRQIRRLVGLED